MRPKEAPKDPFGTMDQKTEFSIWLREMMDERNLNLSQLARETNICRQTITAHLNGTQHPYRSTLRIYSRYFNYPYWDLYEMVMLES